MVVLELLLDPEDGDEEELVVVSFVVLVLLDELLPPAGLLLSTTVVLLLPFAGGVTVSDFCSHAARSAALARMQIYFFIGFWLPSWVNP